MKILLLSIIPFFLFSKELIVATYNVENLFDFKKSGYEYEEFMPNNRNWNKKNYKKKLENVARVICDLDADIIGLQEIENKNALKELTAVLNSHGCKYRYSAITNKKSAINVAVLSKIAIKRTDSIKVSYNNRDRDRDILKVTLRIDPLLTIYVNHWRSKAAPESYRLKYAKALIKNIKKLPKSREYIIIGDFNSNYNECSVIEDRLNDTNGICGIDTLLKTYINKHFLTLDDKDNDESFYNYNLWSDIDSTKRWSHSYYGKKGSLDSIIISKNLNDKNGWFYERKTFSVFKKAYMFKGRKIYRWQYKHGKHLGKGYSDHLPIYAKFSNSLYVEPKHQNLLNRVLGKVFSKKEKIKLIEPKVHKGKLKEVDFSAFFKKKKLDSPMLLKRACVVLKREDSAVLKNSIDSNSIMVYKSAEELDEGRCYRIVVFNKKLYYKTVETTKIAIDKKLDNIDVNSYVIDFSNKLMSEELDNIGDIVKNIKGIYKNGYITVNGESIKLRVKEKRKGILKKGSKLYIKKAQIGYYKGEKELVVYSAKDIIIKEN